MKWLNSMLQDGIDQSVSSKRVVTFIAFLLCAGGFIADIVGYKMTPAIFEAMMYIVIAGLGFTASEKFSSKDKV